MRNYNQFKFTTYFWRNKPGLIKKPHAKFHNDTIELAINEDGPKSLKIELQTVPNDSIEY